MCFEDYYVIISMSRLVDMTDLQKTYRSELFRTVDKTFLISMHD